MAQIQKRRVTIVTTLTLTPSSVIATTFTFRMMNIQTNIHPITLISELFEMSIDCSASPVVLPRRCRVPLSWGIIKLALRNSIHKSHKKSFDRVKAKVRPCSVRLKKYESSSSLAFSRRCIKCPKCDKKFKSNVSMQKHALSHFYQVFFDVLPDCHPFSCPICGKKNRERYTLVRHYALTHKKVFQMTDLVPEELCMVQVETPNRVDEERIKEFLSPYPTEITTDQSLGVRDSAISILNHIGEDMGSLIKIKKKKIWSEE